MDLLGFDNNTIHTKNAHEDIGKFVRSPHVATVRFGDEITKKCGGNSSCVPKNYRQFIHKNNGHIF